MTAMKLSSLRLSLPIFVMNKRRLVMNVAKARSEVLKPSASLMLEAEFRVGTRKIVSGSVLVFINPNVAIVIFLFVVCEISQCSVNMVGVTPAGSCPIEALKVRSFPRASCSNAATVIVEGKVSWSAGIALIDLPMAIAVSGKTQRILISSESDEFEGRSMTS